MKKRLICLAVSLVMVMQMLGGWSAFAADTDDTGMPEGEAAENVLNTEDPSSEDEEDSQDEAVSPQSEEESPQDEDISAPPPGQFW